MQHCTTSADFRCVFHNDRLLLRWLIVIWKRAVCGLDLLLMEETSAASGSLLVVDTVVIAQIRQAVCSTFRLLLREVTY